MKPQLINIDNIRGYRQLGKQTSEELIKGIINEVQDNELTDLLGDSFCTSFLNFIENEFVISNKTFAKKSENELIVTGEDVSSLIGKLLKINNNVFCHVINVNFDVDSTVILSGDIVPDKILSVYIAENEAYTKLLLGDSYLIDGDVVKYKGIKPFLIWHFLANFALNSNAKFADVGVVNIVSNDFVMPNFAAIKQQSNLFVENATNEANRIKNYLNSKQDTFPLWKQKQEIRTNSYIYSII